VRPIEQKAGSENSELEHPCKRSGKTVGIDDVAGYRGLAQFISSLLMSILTASLRHISQHLRKDLKHFAVRSRQRIEGVRQMITGPF
jgi:hypothetical protein